MKFLNINRVIDLLKNGKYNKIVYAKEWGMNMATRKKSPKKNTKNKSNNKIKKTTKELKTSLKKTVEKKTSPKKTTTKKSNTKKSNTPKKVSNPKKTTVKVPVSLELPKTKEEVRIEEETKELELKKELEDKIKTIEENEAKKSKSRLKKKSNAKNIARSKSSELHKKLKKLQRKIKIYGLNSVLPKKYLIWGLIVILLLITSLVVGSYIRPEDMSINLDKVSEEIDGLKTLRFDINNTLDIINDSKSYNLNKENKANLQEYYEYDFDLFNLKRSWLDEFRIYYNEKSKQLFMVFKPNSDNANNVTEAIEKFFKTKKINATKEEYDGYIFYVSSNDDKRVISKIKQSQIKVFDILQDLNKDEIKEVYGIDSSLYKDYKVKTAWIVKANVTEYLLFEPKNNKSAKEIEKLMEAYYSKKESTWEKDSDNLNLLQNRYTGEYNGYLVYIVSKDNDLVLQLIKK